MECVQVVGNSQRRGDKRKGKEEVKGKRKRGRGGKWRNFVQL